MGRVSIFLILCLTMFLLLTFSEKGLVNEDALPTLSLGFVLLSAFLLGSIVRDMDLPMLMGYLLFGILSGPHIFNLISIETTQKLRLIDDIALSLIALTAGGELKLKEIRNILKPLFSITITLTVMVTILTALFIVLLSFITPLFGDTNLLVASLMGVLFGVWAANSSPDITMGVITEYGAKGRVTETILGVTILKDVLVITAFTIFLFLSQNLLSLDGGREAILPALARKIIGSVVVGTGFGWLMAMYIQKVKKEVTLFLIGTALFITTFSHTYNLEPLLVAVAAGFYVENFSKEGDPFIKAIERGSLPVYAVFFAIAGASLDMESFRRLWPLAAVFVGLRTFAIFLGCRLGAIWAGAEKRIRDYAFLGFISQAGITLGLATMVEKRFPVLGMGFKELAMAVIIFNILLGPFTLRFALKRTGEINGNQSSR